MGLQRKQRFVRCLSHVEALEPRQMFSVVNVTPSNFLAAIKSSGSGDTINFAPGEYDIADGGKVELPGDRTYVGNGALFKGTGTGCVNFGYTNNSDFSGFTLDGVFASADAANNLYFHNNTLRNMSTAGFTNTDMTNSRVNNNTFTNMNGGVYGYPLGGNKIDGNRFDFVIEPIHFSCYATADGLEISGNVITHATRIGIELQRSINNLTVTNNYMSDWLQYGTGSDDAHMGISCATAGTGLAPFNDQAQHVNISGNVLIQNGPAQSLNLGAKAGIEIMGCNDININNNYFWNWGAYLLNGAICGVNSNNNTVVGGDLYSPDNVGWLDGPVSGSGDTQYALNASNAPSAPSAPSAGADTQSAPTAPVVTTPAPAPAPVVTPAPANASPGSGANASPGSGANASPGPGPNANPGAGSGANSRASGGSNSCPDPAAGSIRDGGCAGNACENRGSGDNRQARRQHFNDRSNNCAHEQDSHDSHEQHNDRGNSGGFRSHSPR